MNNTISNTLLSELIAARMESTTLLHEQLESELITAAQIIEKSLNKGGKLYFIASPGLHSIASQAVDNLMSLKLSSQPAIPAILLHSLKGSHSEHKDRYDTAFMQLQAVADSNDCVILLDESSSNDSFKQLHGFFSTLNYGCVSILHLDSLQPLPKKEAESHQLCWIPIFNDLTMLSIARKQELSLFILNCLSAMIEQAMFGTQIDQTSPVDPY